MTKLADIADSIDRAIIQSRLNSVAIMMMVLTPAGFRVRPDRLVVRTGCPVNDAGRG